MNYTGGFSIGGLSPPSKNPNEKNTWEWKLQPLSLNSSCPIILLVHAGANLQQKNNSGFTPLMQAIADTKKNRTKIKHLVCYSKPEDLNATDFNHCTALHHLAKSKAKYATDSNFLKEVTKV